MMTNLDQLDPEWHPALDRFLRKPHGGERLLIVQAPQGTGRHWFAEGWIRAQAPASQDRTGQDREDWIQQAVVDWDPATQSAATVVARLRELADRDPDQRMALVAGSDAPVLEVAAALRSRTVGAPDLMLVVEEIHGVLGSTPGQPPSADPGAERPTAREVYRSTGGWLSAVHEVADSDLSAGPGWNTLTTPLAQWLRCSPLDEGVSAVSYLPRISQETLGEFHPEGMLTVPTVEELAALGVIRWDSDDSWFMPTLVRDAVQARLRAQKPHLVPHLAGAAARTMAAVGSLDGALDTAVSGRAWRAIGDVFAGRWAELFSSDARLINAALSRLPGLVRHRYEDINVVLRIMSAAGPDRMNLPGPATKPDLANDATAHRLAQRAERAHRSPTAVGVSYGLLEVGYLRLSGHYEASADAAVRLRQTLHTSGWTHPLSKSLGCQVDLQCGISIYLADRIPEALLAFRSAQAWVQDKDHPFLRSDVLAKQALVHAQLGNLEQSRRDLAALAEYLARVGWGQGMVGRCGDLARAWIAFRDLDVAALEEALARLPGEPDDDEFWSVHAYLSAQLDILRGRPQQAMDRVAGWRQGRPYATAARLADRLLSEAHHWAAVSAGSVAPVPGWETNQVLANLEAVRCLRTGNPDTALVALGTPVRTDPGPRRLSEHLRSCAEHWPLHDHEQDVVREIARVHGEGGELSELMPLCQLGLLPALRAAGVVDEAQGRRLSSAMTGQPGLPAEQPTLTPREQEMLSFLRLGLSRREIAAASYRSENTAKSQLRSLYAKLEASSAQEALEAARRFGL